MSVERKVKLIRKAREKVDSHPEPALNILLSHEFLKAKGGGRGGGNLTESQLISVGQEAGF